MSTVETDEEKELFRETNTADAIDCYAVDSGWESDDSSAHTTHYSNLDS